MSYYKKYQKYKLKYNILKNMTQGGSLSESDKKKLYGLKNELKTIDEECDNILSKLYDKKNNLLNDLNALDNEIKDTEQYCYDEKNKLVLEIKKIEEQKENKLNLDDYLNFAEKELGFYTQYVTPTNRDELLDFIDVQKSILGTIEKYFQHKNIESFKDSIKVTFPKMTDEQFKNINLSYFENKIIAIKDALNRLNERIKQRCHTFIIGKNKNNNTTFSTEMLVSATLDVVNNKYIYHVGIVRPPLYILNCMIKNIKMEQNISMMLHAYSILHFTNSFKKHYDLLVVPLSKMRDILTSSAINYDEYELNNIQSIKNKYGDIKFPEICNVDFGPEAKTLYHIHNKSLIDYIIKYIDSIRKK